MSTNSCDDRWLLPRHQTEYPARDVLPEARLHRRREATFLAFAALVLVTITALIVLGTSHVVDVSRLTARISPSLELPLALLLPLGAVPFALGIVASMLVCELFGRHRATALVWAGLAASIAVAGLMRAADAIDGGNAFAASLALAACIAVAHACNVIVFAGLGRRARGRYLFARVNLASLLAQTAGWAAFAGVLHVTSARLGEALGVHAIAALAMGAAGWSIACVFVLTIPVVLIARALALALRVGRDPIADDDHDDVAGVRVARRLPPALIVDDDDVPDEPVGSRTRPASIPPYTSAEMRFFIDGELL